MNHLSSQQIFGCLIGDVAFAGHARECALCNTELARFEQSLAWFRSSVRNWSDQVTTGQFETAPVLFITPDSLDRPWYQNILRALRDAIHPPKLAPLQVTSKPVPVREIWGFFGGNGRAAGATSALVHCLVVALLFALGSLKPVQKAVHDTITLMAPDLQAYRSDKQNHGGGGGGTRSALDATKGKLPKIATKQFTPPMAVVENPKLVMDPTIVLEVTPPNIDFPSYGDPLSRLATSSNGPGSGGGIGNGIGTGVGPGKGPGYGPGSGGNVGGGAYKIGGGVSAPSVLFKVEPEYSEEARKAKFQGTVVLQVVVDERGLPQQIKVTRPLGLGLDQKAIEAVAKWRFKPGLKDGKPVSVWATIEVNFRLL